MSPNGLAQLLPIVVLLVLVYLLFIRPARKRAHDVSTLQAALSSGDEVMLSSGIFGRVTAVVGEKVHVEVAADVVLVVHRGAIAKIVHDVPAEDRDASPTAEQSDLRVDGPETDDGTRGAG